MLIESMNLLAMLDGGDVCQKRTDLVDGGDM